jgi:two-component sensor histidine kinase
LLLKGVQRLYQDNKTDLSLSICAQVIEFRKVIDPTDIRAYDMMTLFSIYKGDLDKALLYGLKAASIQENAGTRDQSERPYDNLGKAYAELGKNDLALKYFQRAISILRKRDTVVYGEILKNITQLLLRMGKPEEALSVVNENLSSRSFADPYDRETIKEIYGNCYFALGQYEAAEKNYLERYSAVARMHDKVELLIASLPLARLYMKTGKFDKAGFYLNQLIGDSNKGWVPISVQRDVQNMLYQADSARGDYSAAVGHIKLFKLLNDSIFNTAKNRQIEELRVQYETEKKDQQIQLLVNQSDLKNAALQRTRFIRNVSLVGAVLLIILLLLGYNRYLIKRKSNISLEAQKEIIRQNNIDLHLLNDRQNKLLAEKEWLMKEVHHRVKNNMQIIISLLNAQAEFLDNPFAVNAIVESRERMQAMALIHQRLYLSHENTLIGMRSYVREIVEYLDSGLSNAGRISFELSVDDIDLDIAEVVPLGLVINEAVTNAIKYAFPDGRPGVIRIALQRTVDRFIKMRISDNGVGFTRGSPIEESNSFGIQLIRLFAEQLEGTLTFETERGVAISLFFQEQEAVDDISHLQTRQTSYGENTDC